MHCHIPVPYALPCSAELDDDVPGQGKFYCIPCARYFQNAAALVDHEKTKPHKRTWVVRLSVCYMWPC